MSNSKYDENGRPINSKFKLKRSINTRRSESKIEQYNQTRNEVERKKYEEKYNQEILKDIHEDSDNMEKEVQEKTGIEKTQEITFQPEQFGTKEISKNLIFGFAFFSLILGILSILVIMWCFNNYKFRGKLEVKEEISLFIVILPFLFYLAMFLGILNINIFLELLSSII